MRPRLIALCLCLLGLFIFEHALAEGPTTHTVAWGETLYSVARAYDTSPQAIADANGLTLNDWLTVGQQLKIPAGASSDSTVPAPQKSPSGIYTVRAGDTLFSLAAQFGISVDALAAANSIPPNGVIYVGSQLKIPSANASPKSSTASQVASGTSVQPSSTRATNYIVQPGDNLFRIALKYDTTTQSIALANNLPSMLVYVGQPLLIPTGTSSQSNSAGTNRAPSLSNISSSASAGLNVRVSGVPLYRQQQTLTCEESAAAMALRGAISEAQLVKVMPRSDNPFQGIRGSTNNPLIGGLTHYGTYAHALQKGLAALGHSSRVLYGQAYADFKQAVIASLNAGKPVVWWTTWKQKYETPRLITTASGASVKLTPYEHTVVIVAANDNGVTYHDPYDATIGTTSWNDFRRTSAYFDNMALIVQ